jgi:putative oxidoreductase
VLVLGELLVLNSVKLTLPSPDGSIHPDQVIQFTMKFLKLSFLSNLDVGCLILRVWLGLTMLINHGLPKAMNFAATSAKFPDPLGIGVTNSLGLAVLAEVVCAALLIVGFFTRLAAVFLVVTMAVAFLIVHKGSLAMGPGSGELSFVYLAGFVSIIFLGAGRYSLDRND